MVDERTNETKREMLERIIAYYEAIRDEKTNVRFDRERTNECCVKADRACMEWTLDTLRFELEEIANGEDVVVETTYRRYDSATFDERDNAIRADAKRAIDTLVSSIFETIDDVSTDEAAEVERTTIEAVLRIANTLRLNVTKSGSDFDVTL